MNRNDLVIGVLSVTAVVLLAAFLLLQAMPAPAIASGEGGTVGNYVVSTAHVDDQCEVIAILDSTTQRLNYYQLDLALNELLPIQSFDVRDRPGQRDNRRPLR